MRGAAFQGVKSSGDVSAVSITRRQPRSVDGGVAGTSNVNGFQ
jgi:hypothetical protein